MKNPGGIVLLSVALLFLGFFLGFLAGKITPAKTVTLSAYDRIVNDSMNDPYDPSVPGKININRASEDILCTIPGIGETLAKRIIEYREDYGPFTSILELSRIKGISEESVQKLSEYITVGG